MYPFSLVICSDHASESKVIQNIRLEGSPWQISYAPDGKTLLAVGNDNSRTIFLFQHGWKEEERKEMWSLIDTPKHSPEQGNTVSWQIPRNP
jgi:hypothetical protein